MPIRIEQRDRQPVGLEGLGRPHADRLHDRLEVELLRRLPTSFTIASSATRWRTSADARTRLSAEPMCWPTKEQANVVIGVELAGLIGLHDEHPQRSVHRREADSEPVDALHADHRDIALGRELQLTFGRHVLRLAGPRTNAVSPLALPIPNGSHP